MSNWARTVSDAVVVKPLLERLKLGFSEMYGHTGVPMSSCGKLAVAGLSVRGTKIT